MLTPTYTLKSPQGKWKKSKDKYLISDILGPMQKKKYTLKEMLSRIEQQIDLIIQKW